MIFWGDIIVILYKRGVPSYSFSAAPKRLLCAPLPDEGIAAQVQHLQGLCLVVRLRCSLLSQKLTKSPQPCIP